MINKLTIIGIGLIGGSLALALKAKGVVGEIVGTGRREASLRKAQELGVIDSWTLDLKEAVSGADVVVIATPTLVAEQVLLQLLPLVDDATIITDVASVKGGLLRAVTEACGDVPANLVLGHPIAGSEQSGVEAAKATLFENHRVILTPQPTTAAKALAVIDAMWRETGAELVHMEVAEHDAVLAATSHLPHVLAYALVDALAKSSAAGDIFRFAAGGFRDFTRIASSDPLMWQEIVLANRQAVLAAMDSFSANLATLRQAIDSGDSDAIMAVFDNAKQSRDRYFVSSLNHNQD